MTNKEFVTSLLRCSGCVQFREIDRCTTDYTLRKTATKECVVKSIWSSEKHTFGPEEELSIEESCSEIIGRIEKAKKLAI